MTITNDTPTTEQLYAINDALTALMGQFDVYAGLTDEQVDDMLDNATMAVAGFFWPTSDKN